MGICLVIISEWPPLSHIDVVLVNRELSDGSVNGPRVTWRIIEFFVLNPILSDLAILCRIVL